VLIQAQAICMAFVSDRLRVKQGLALAEFPEVICAWIPFLEVGASICAAVNMLAADSLPKYPEDTWVQYFWRRSCEVQPVALYVYSNRGFKTSRAISDT
jgi:hypothetical protein